MAHKRVFWEDIALSNDDNFLCYMGGGTLVKRDDVVTGAPSGVGTAILVAGTVVVANPAVGADTIVVLTRSLVGGTPGHLSYIVEAGVGFTIDSSEAADTSTVKWFLVEPSS